MQNAAESVTAAPPQSGWLPGVPGSVRARPTQKRISLRFCLTNPIVQCTHHRDGLREKLVTLPSIVETLMNRLTLFPPRQCRRRTFPVCFDIRAGQCLDTDSQRWT